MTDYIEKLRAMAVREARLDTWDLLLDIVEQLQEDGQHTVASSILVATKKNRDKAKLAEAAK